MSDTVRDIYYMLKRSISVLRGIADELKGIREELRLLREHIEESAHDDV